MRHCVRTRALQSASIRCWMSDAAPGAHARARVPVSVNPALDERRGVGRTRVRARSCQRHSGAG
eukprot:10087129-Alexandrium_andersonii.AAC.1